MQEEIAALRAELESRDLKLKDAGSIAEAVVKLNALFETAQKTADDYVEQVKRVSCEAIREAARKEAAEIVRRAKEQAEALKKEAAPETPDAPAEAKESSK